MREIIYIGEKGVFVKSPYDCEICGKQIWLRSSMEDVKAFVDEKTDRIIWWGYNISNVYEVCSQCRARRGWESKYHEAIQKELSLA